MANFFNSICADGVLEEESIYYFNQDFKLIGKDYTLSDTDGDIMKNADCYFPYDYEYVIPKNINEFLK